MTALTLPPPTAGVPDAEEYTALPALDGVPEQLVGGLLAAQELSRRSIAENTRKNLRYHWQAWRKYCKEVGATALPADPQVVAAHLATIAARVEDGRIVRDDEGRMLPGRLRAATVAQRLWAIDRKHRIAGHPRPGGDPTVADVMAGIKRTFLLRVTQAKAALDMGLLLQLLEQVRAEPAELTRDRALVVLAVRPGLGAGQLARLHDVELLDGAVRLAVPSPTGGASTSVTLRASGGAGCPVAALAAVLAGHDGTRPVFRHADGRALTRQGIRSVLRRLAAAAGRTLGPDERPDAVLLRRMLRNLSRPTLAQVRDEALLLTGWYAALRRSNIVGLDWGHLRPDGPDWEVTLVRSKPDQEGEGEINWLVESPNPAWPCPATALSAWRARVAELIGGDPCELIPDQPVFMPVDRHGNPRTDGGRFVRASTDAVCELVKRWAGAAGLDPAGFGAHSLRAGFVTEALTDGKLTLADTQDVTHHKTLDVLVRYDRRIRSRRSNPISSLFAAAPSASAPAPPPTEPADQQHLPPALRRRAASK